MSNISCDNYIAISDIQQIDYFGGRVGSKQNERQQIQTKQNERNPAKTRQDVDAVDFARKFEAELDRPVQRCGSVLASSQVDRVVQ